MFKNPIIWFCIIICFPYISFAKDSHSNSGTDSVSIIQGLDTPWEILWGPDDHIWLTERYGRISRVNPNTGTKQVLLDVPGVHEQSESGLMGMVLHPGFQANPYVYIAYNYMSSSRIFLRVCRFTYNQGTLISPDTLIEGISGNSNHNGCRLMIGQDMKLYVTTGDAQNTSLAQNLLSLSGKILRLNLDGTVPSDNPFPGSYIWSLGHRNPQGLLQTPSGLIYSSEHGPSNDDEMNLIEKGRNYGWPDVHGFCNLTTEQSFCVSQNVREPLVAWTPTIATAGIDYYSGTRIPGWDNSILLVNLKASKLVVLKLSQDGKSVLSQQDYFTNWWGRLRDVCVSPGGRVFIATSNRDGRGTVRSGDDRIVEILPVTSTGNKTNHLDHLRIYPNPVTGTSVRLENLHEGEIHLMITDIAGKLLFEMDHIGSHTAIEIPFPWKSGVYVLKALKGSHIFNQLMIKP